MAATVVGLLDWTLERDVQGYRTYLAEFLIETSDVEDGPATALFATGLPSPGSTWTYGNDNDPYVYCSPEIKLKPQLSGEPDDGWIAVCTFTNKPFPKCGGTPVENPLLEPYKLSGSFRKYPKTATKDRFDNPLTYSNHELMKGELVRIEEPRPTIELSFNLAFLPFSTLALCVNRLNDAPLWGFPARTVKLTDVSYVEKFYGTCWKYYTVSYTFEISIVGWDVDILDEGRKVLKKGGVVTNPNDFEIFKDLKDENSTILLDGAGKPLTDINNPVYLHKEILRDANLLLLGIPAVL